MARRELLHISKLNDFGKWLEEQGYMILPTSKNPYEVLRAKKDKDIVIIYCKASSKEHLSIMDKDYSLIRRFINESKKNVNVDRIENMTENEAVKYMKIERECINRNCDRNCAECDIVQEVDDLNSAYDVAIKALKDISWYQALGNKEECQHQRSTTIYHRPYRHGIIPDDIACDNIKQRKYDKRHFMQDTLPPGEPAWFHQFHQYKDVKGNDNDVGSGHHSPPPICHVIHKIING